MRLLCFGKNGLLSQELQRWCQELNPIAMRFVSQSECDITKKDEVMALCNDFKPTHVINAAAYTKVDDCETNVGVANMVNGFSLAHIVAACNDHQAVLIHFSTDYIFNGKKDGPYEENDQQLPINAYGTSKQIGEDIIRKQLVEHYILRIQWVFGLAGPNFISAILTKAKKGDALSVVDDQWGTPTSTTTISKGVVNLINNGPEYGTYHFRSLNHTSWYDYATFVLNQCNIKVPVKPVSSDAYRAKAKRPKNGVLNVGKWIYSDLYTPPTWTRDVSHYLKEAQWV